MPAIYTHRQSAIQRDILIMLCPHKELERIFQSPVPAVDPFRPVSPQGVILYGAGEMGEMAVMLMEHCGQIPLAIVDKSKTGSIQGIPIVTPNQLSDQQKKQCTFIVTIATIPFLPIRTFLEQEGCLDVRHFYDYSEIMLREVMPNGWYYPHLTSEEKDSLRHIVHRLSHCPTSPWHYLQFVWWRVRRQEQLYAHAPVLTGQKYFSAPFFPPLTEHEVLLDGGSHLGQTIERFIAATGGKFSHIHAVEPDTTSLTFNQNAFRTFAHYHHNALSDTNETLCFCPNLGYASHTAATGSTRVQAVTIDSLACDPTIIKLHVEGDELKALHGAYNTIRRCRPIIMVFADHSPDGLYAIPEYLLSFNEYTLHFAVHDYCGNSAIFYAFPSTHASDTGKAHAH